MKTFFHRDILFATLLIFLFLKILRFLISVDFELFNPMEAALQDFDITDISYRFHHPEKIPVDKNIVLVNISNDRENIARQISIIRKHHPKVIGLDVRFANRKQDNLRGDSILAAEIDSTPQLVTAGILQYKSETSEEPDGMGCSNPFFKLINKEGFTNLISTNTESTVRFYSAFAKLKGEDRMSFTSKIIEKYDSSIFKKLKNRYEDAIEKNSDTTRQSQNSLSIKVILAIPH
jgi:CHASE2 domain-containing sensor protein